MSKQQFNQYNGRVYQLSYFSNKPVLNPLEFMAGQRLWRPFILEERWVYEGRLNTEALLREDHSYSYIHSITNTRLHVCYNKYTRKLND